MKYRNARENQKKCEALLTVRPPLAICIFLRAMYHFFDLVSKQVNMIIAICVKLRPFAARSCYCWDCLAICQIYS